MATRAAISRAAYSKLERGQLDATQLATLRRVANVLEVRLTLDAGWRGGRIERLISGRHASMAERVTRRLLAAGWTVVPEVSFNHFGERGVVDLVAWHAPTRTMLLVEIKTELVDPNGLLEATNRRRRLAYVIARDQGWEPDAVAQWVILDDGRTNHRRVAEHRTLLRSAFPGDGRAVDRWLSNPISPMNALWFLPSVTPESTRRSARGPTRVRRPAGRAA